MKVTKSFLVGMSVCAALVLSGCGGGGSDTPNDQNNAPVNPGNGNGGNGNDNGGNNGGNSGSETTKEEVTLSGYITEDKTLTADKVWVLDGLVVVKAPAKLTIQPGTIIAGKSGTGAQTSYMIVDKGAQIIANGTEAKPIVFTSYTAYKNPSRAKEGQWGGLTIIGKAGNDQVDPYEVNPDFVAENGQLHDNSGILRHVKILNSGITMEENKEVNGLSLVGVGDGTTIEYLTVNKSDDDCVEVWGGTVNFNHVNVSECTDDQFDIDDGYAGTVRNLVINQTTGNSGIEMSGNTHATFDGFTINVEHSYKEGAIYFKKDGIGGYFKNGQIHYNTSQNGYGALHSRGNIDDAHISFENVTIDGTNPDKFTGDGASILQAKFENQNQ